MSYDEMAKKATMKYIKTKQQEIKIRFKKDDYEKNIQPAIEMSGLPTAAYIKKAIQEKIERDGLLTGRGENNDHRFYK